MVYHVINYYSIIIINALSGYEKTWGNLKCIFFSEGSQSENVTFDMISTLGLSQDSKIIKRSTGHF